MKKSHVETIKAWINAQPGIKRPSVEPTPGTPFLNSKQRNYLKWRAKGL